MPVVYKVTPPNAGRFLVYPQEEAERLVLAGDAQWPNTEASKIRTPEYKTREVRAEQPDQAEAKPKPKAKRKRKKKVTPDSED